MMKKGLTVKKITLIGLFTALIAVLAQVSVPFYPVPFTGQVFGVLLAGVLLGSRAGVLCIIAYLMLGAAGVPVFAMGRGGLQVLLGPTGGYLLGFIPAVYLLGRLTADRPGNNKLMLVTGMLGFLALLYMCGGLQLSYIMKLDLKQTLIAGVIPFLPLDIIKAALVIPLARRLDTLPGSERFPKKKSANKDSRPV